LQTAAFVTQRHGIGTGDAARELLVAQSIATEF
jgi:hypothetical protein